MKLILVNSDQSKDWSDYEKQFASLFEEKKELFSKTTNYIRKHGYPRIINRKIQTLRKTALHVYSGSRSWPQILSLQKCSWKSSKDGIYSSERQRKNSNLYPKLHRYQKTIRRNLRNQSGALPKRNTISVEYEIRLSKSHLQLLFSCNCHCEYAAKSFNFGW